MLKMSSISDLKRPTAPKNTRLFNMMMQRTANENAACYSWARFHILYCNSAGLSNVVRYNGVPLYRGLLNADCSGRGDTEGKVELQG